MNRTVSAFSSAVSFSLWLAASWLSCTGASADKLDAERLFDPERLVQIEIRLAEKDWEELCRQTRWAGGFAGPFAGSADDPFTYFQGDVTIDGTEIKSVGIRKKGFFGSLDEVRPSLKIEFDEYVDQRPLGNLDRLTLNNNKQDKSLVSQYLAYKIFNDAGVHAPRCNLAMVTVNGEYLGIYSNVESVRKPFLKARFGNDDGDLFEGTVVDFHGKTLEKFEAKTNERSHDRRKLARLAELLAAEGDLPLDELESLVDIDYFLKFWAVESLLGFWDGYTQDQNNFFVYDNPRSGKFHFVPWGADVCFTKGGGPFAAMSGGDRSEAVYAEAILPNRLFHTEGIPDRYKQTMLQILEEAWDEEQLVAEVDRVEALTRDLRHKDQLPTENQAQWGIRSPTPDDVREFIRSRRQEITSELANWPAKIPAKPRTPMYVVEVGTASGSFQTQWSQQPNDGNDGQLELTLHLDGEDVTLREPTVGAFPLRFPGFGGPAGGAGERTPPAMIVIKGTRATDEKSMTLVLMMDQKALTAEADQPISVSGLLTIGENRGFGFGLPTQMVSGTLNLSARGTNEGDALAGDFEIKIVEMHGGMMQPRRRGE